jgi:hypothetical protein
MLKPGYYIIFTSGASNSFKEKSIRHVILSSPQEPEETLTIPDSHKCICESGLSGRRHGRNGSDVDELLVLLTENNTLCILEGARRSRLPQMNISSMPSSVQEISAKTAQEDEQRQNRSIGKEENK